MKLREIEDKNKEREAKREQLNKRLEEKKKHDKLRVVTQAALEEDKKKINQQAPNVVTAGSVLENPTSSKLGGVSKRGDGILKKQSLPNLMPAVKVAGNKNNIPTKKDTGSTILLNGGGASMLLPAIQDENTPLIPKQSEGTTSQGGGGDLKTQVNTFDGDDDYIDDEVQE